MPASRLERCLEQAATRMDAGSQPILGPTA
jgi:hypothetical protein